MDLDLDNKQRKQLRDALLAAFPSRAALAELVEDALDQNLAAIAGGDNLASAVFDLLQWARARGKMRALVTGALEANPTNPELRAFAQSLGLPLPAAAVSPAQAEPDPPADPGDGRGKTTAAGTRTEPPGPIRQRWALLPLPAAGGSPASAEPTPSADPGDGRGKATAAGTRTEPPGPIRNRWALLVGINHYIDPAFPDLKFCVNDVQTLGTVLKGAGYTAVAMYDDSPEEHRHPTCTNIEAELLRMQQAAGPDDLLWVHFAGHGTLRNGQPILIARDTRELTMARTGLPLTEVEATLRKSKARRLILTLDACHTGVESGRDLTDPAFIRNAYELAEGFALLAASTSQQLAQEWDDKKHGVFTYYLLEGLTGRADVAGKRFVTVDDIKNYTLAELRRWNFEQGGRIQEPTARTEGMGDIILVDRRSTVLSEPRAYSGINSKSVGTNSPTAGSVDQVRAVLAACSRRAIFARMQAQLNWDAMFESLRACRIQLQQIAAFVEPAEWQRLVAQIIGELDRIERFEQEYRRGGEIKDLVDAAKLRIIHLLGELADAAHISFVLPMSLTEDFFWSRQEADMPPEPPARA
jgi:hypothetical protein